jgi:hypothetical protein
LIFIKGYDIIINHKEQKINRHFGDLFMILVVL